MSEENITITIMNKDSNCNKIMKSIIKNVGGAEKRTFSTTKTSFYKSVKMQALGIATVRPSK
jgi:hypothetical protein